MMYCVCMTDQKPIPQHPIEDAYIRKERSILQDILDELKRNNTLLENASRQKRYWTAEDIAFQMGKSKSSVQSRYVYLPSFPKPRRIPSDKGRGHPIWLASEVLAWIEKHKEK